jgi:3-hydroxyisobutyrate dehydrogenase-like beta-hydroxyacid dehydrogenase
MCLNLAKNGHAVVAFDLNTKALNEAEKAGIQCVAKAEELGSSACSLIFTMLPGCDAVNKVMPLLIDSAPSGSSLVFVDCSTVHPTTSRQWYQEAASRGHSRIDAPVSGGVKVSYDHNYLIGPVVCTMSTDGGKISM